VSIRLRGCVCNGGEGDHRGGKGVYGEDWTPVLACFARGWGKMLHSSFREALGEATEGEKEGRFTRRKNGSSSSLGREVDHPAIKATEGEASKEKGVRQKRGSYFLCGATRHTGGGERQSKGKSRKSFRT